MTPKKLYILWRDRRLHKKTKEAADRISGYFCIQEKSGVLYIVCDGVAVTQVPEDASAKEIAKNLKECRAAAIKHRLEGVNKETGFFSLLFL